MTTVKKLKEPTKKEYREMLEDIMKLLEMALDEEYSMAITKEAILQRITNIRKKLNL